MGSVFTDVTTGSSRSISLNVPSSRMTAAMLATGLLSYSYMAGCPVSLFCMCRGFGDFDCVAAQAPNSAELPSVRRCIHSMRCLSLGLTAPAAAIAGSQRGQHSEVLRLQLPGLEVLAYDCDGRWPVSHAASLQFSTFDSCKYLLSCYVI